MASTSPALLAARRERRPRRAVSPMGNAPSNGSAAMNPPGTARDSGSLDETARPLRGNGWRVLLAALVAAPSLSGCILERVMETHAQLCDASPPEVAVVDGPNGGLKLLFSRPTLTAEDIGWLVGVKPTRIEPRGDELAWIYSAAPSARPESGERLSSELRFRNDAGTFKLAETVPPARFGPLMSRDLIARSIAAACHPQISLSPPGARFQIRGLPRGGLPDYAGVTPRRGPPPARRHDPEGIEYRYCLLPCADDTSYMARFRYEFVPGRRLQRAEFVYFRYVLTVDPIAGYATISLRL
jgi:hypothetical protein